MKTDYVLCHTTENGVQYFAKFVDEDDEQNIMINIKDKNGNSLSKNVMSLSHLHNYSDIYLKMMEHK